MSHARILGMLAAIAGATIGLHFVGGSPALAVDWYHLAAWLDTADPADAVGALFRYVGLAIGYWVLATSGLYYAAKLLRRERRPGWLTLATLPPIRRAIDRALAASLAISIVTTPIGSLRAEESQPTPPVVFEVPSDGIPVPHVGSDRGDAAVGEVPPLTEPPAVQQTPTTEDAATMVDAPDVALSQPAVAVDLPVIVAPSEATSTADRDYTVAAGDNLWSIAATNLEAVRGGNLSVADIDAYWREVISVNRDTLRSGDPNLIFPGEMITLPEVPQ